MSIKQNIKRRMLMVAALAMTVAVLAAGPAHADTKTSFSVKNSGDYASQVLPAQQLANSGNFNNAPSFVQFDSKAADYKPGGIKVSFSPEVAVKGSNVVQQSSAASSR